MPTLGLEDHIVDRGVYDRTVRRFRDAQVLLPTFAELAEPHKIPAAVRHALAAVKPDEAAPAQPVPGALVQRRRSERAGRRPRARGAWQAS